MKRHGRTRSVLAGVSVALIAAGCSTERPDFAAAGAQGWRGGGASSGPCAPEGTVAPCHEELGRHGEIVTCIDGETFCFGGAWSRCLQKSAAAVRSVKLPSGSGLHTLTAAPAATGCVGMPCDPSCQISRVPGPFSGTGAAGTVVGVNGGFLGDSNLPGNCSTRNGGATAYSCSGFKAKTTDPDRVCARCSARNMALNGTVTARECESACQSDQHCTGDATDSCTAFAAGETSSCTGIDVTVPVACLDSSGRETISVCNRGTANLTSPVECCQFPGNSAHFDSDLENGAACAGGTLLGTTTGNIAAGTCQALVIYPTGNTSSIICNPHYTMGTPRGVTECNDNNNWTAYKRGNSCVSQTTGGSYSPRVLTYDYPSTCPVGFRPQWGYLVWDAQTPSARGSTSSVTFEAQTQWLTPTVKAASAWVPLASTAPPFGNPAVCPFTGVAGCPIDLFTALGQNVKADKLTLKITLTPSCDLTASPCTGTVTPTLSSWGVTYGCVDSE